MRVISPAFLILKVKIWTSTKMQMKQSYKLFFRTF